MTKRRMTKVLACVLAVLMLIGAMPFASVAALPEKAEGYNRYYFYLPEGWFNEYTDSVGIYWWEGTDACSAYPGYEAVETEVENVYYCDVPQDVTAIIWNNYLYVNTEEPGIIGHQTCNIGTEYYEPGESDNYPDGTDDFDEMIYVIAPELTTDNKWSTISVYEGEWYYYYGNGEYGFAENKEDADEVFTGRTRSLFGHGAVESIEYQGDVIEIYENVDGYISERYNYDTEEYEEYFEYKLPDSDTIIIKVVYEDGYTEYVSINDIVNGEWFYAYSYQYDEPWTAGGEYSFIVELFDLETEIPVVISDTPVEKIEVIDGEIILNEYEDFYYEEIYDEEAESYKMIGLFDYYSFIKSVQVEITYKNGDTVTAFVGDTINDRDVSYYDNQFNEPWTVGGDNPITIRYMGAETQLSATIIPNPVESLEIIEGSVTCIENYNGRWYERYNYDTGEWEEYFDYTYDLSDFVFRVNYKDGTSEELAYWDVTEEGYEVCADDSQYDTPWAIGGENLITFCFRGVCAEFSAEIIPNPVESLEIIDGSITCIENINGGWDNRYNSDTDEWEEFFRYTYDLSDFVFRVNYKDGTSEELGYWDVTEEGYEVYRLDTQHDTPWTKDGENVLTFDFLGAKAQVYANIVETPVESLEIIEGSVACVENYYGYLDEYFNSETGEWEEFFYYSYDLSDFVFRVNYKDGTSEELGYWDVTEEGYEVYADDSQYDEPWTVGGENLITFTFLGVTTQYSVEVVSNPVVSIEYLGEPITIYENGIGFWYDRYNEETEEWEEYFEYDVDLDDIQIQINYEDSTSRIATIDEILYGDGFDLDIDQDDNPWYIGADNYFTISYMDKEVQIPVIIVESPVERIELINGTEETYINGEDGSIGYFYDKETDKYVRYFYYNTWDHYDAQITIYYKDGSTKTAYVGDEVDEGYFVDWDSNQYRNPWEVGENDTIISYIGAETTLPVLVEESGVESISILGLDKIEVMEYTNGMWDVLFNEETQEYEDVYIYDIYELLAAAGDVEVMIEYKDGTAGILDIFSGDVLIDYYGQYYFPWTPDAENSLAINHLGAEVEIPVIIIPNTDIEDDPTESTEPIETTAPTDPVIPTEPTEGSGPVVNDPVEDNAGSDDITGGDSAPTEAPATEATDTTEASATEDEPTAPEATEAEPTTPATEDEPTEPSEPTQPSEPTEPDAADKGILGDINGDGKINIKDATQIQKFAAKMVELTEAEQFVADVNSDGKVNVKDATAIQKHLAKIDTGLPIGKPA